MGFGEGSGRGSPCGKRRNFLEKWSAKIGVMTIFLSLARKKRKSFGKVTVEKHQKRSHSILLLGTATSEACFPCKQEWRRSGKVRETPQSFLFRPQFFVSAPPSHDQLVSASTSAQGQEKRLGRALLFSYCFCCLYRIVCCRSLCCCLFSIYVYVYIYIYCVFALLYLVTYLLLLCHYFVIALSLLCFCFLFVCLVVSVLFLHRFCLCVLCPLLRSEAPHAPAAQAGMYSYQQQACCSIRAKNSNPCPQLAACILSSYAARGCRHLGSERTTVALLDLRQITHLICVLLKHLLYDFWGGVLGLLPVVFLI